MPDDWEGLLKGYVKRTFLAGTRKQVFADREDFTEGDYRFFARGVRELNISFTQERHELPKNYFNQKELRSGYILYFLPINALKVTALLSQQPIHPRLTPQGHEFTILDVGSGPGTGMLGVMAYLENVLRRKKTGALKLRFILIDQNKPTLNDASELFEEALKHLQQANPSWRIEGHLQRIVANLFSEKISQVLKPQKADLILSLNFLSELPKGKRLPLVDILLRNYLHPSGKLLVIEPALRQTTRDLMELRDQITAEESAFILAPCLHQEACPMLKVSGRDWCHVYIPWERPVWIEKIDRLVGIRKDYLMCSYLLMGREPVSLESLVAGKTASLKGSLWRVVSGPLNSNGKSERLLCGPAQSRELLRITRLDRDQSQANKDFDELERGDLVILPKISRVTRETLIKKI